jgi:hypothetical protein
MWRTSPSSDNVDGAAGERVGVESGALHFEGQALAAQVFEQGGALVGQ